MIETADRFDWAGALWKFCSEYHSGMGSRGYRILSRLAAWGYNPGAGLQRGCFESEAQAELYFHFVENYADSV